MFADVTGLEIKTSILYIYLPINSYMTILYCRDTLCSDYNIVSVRCYFFRSSSLYERYLRFNRRRRGIILSSNVVVHQLQQTQQVGALDCSVRHPIEVELTGGCTV